MNIQSIFNKELLYALQQFFNKIGDRAVIDHVGYKCASHDEYKKIRSLFMSQQHHFAVWAMNHIFPIEKLVMYVSRIQ